MKKVKKITLCGIFTALSVVIMMLSYFPYLTYAIPALSGLCIMVLVVEINKSWALGAYLASSVLVFLFAEPEAKLMYIGLLGYYPIVKALIESINKPIIEWVLKLIVFNAAVLIIYALFAKFFGVTTEDFGELGKYGAYIFLAIGNIVFVVYDFAISRVAVFYLNIVRPKLKRLL